MATLLLDPHSEYRTRATKNGYTNAQGNAIRSWGSTWKNYTSQDSRDSDANAFYFAQFYYHEGSGIEEIHDWSCRLSFTIPADTSISKVNKITIKMKAVNGNGKVTYPRVILSDANYGPDPQLITNDSNSHIAYSEFYKNPDKSANYHNVPARKYSHTDENGEQIYKANPEGMLADGAYVYLIFDTFSKTLVPGTTYYIYFVPYYHAVQEIVDFDDNAFQSRNLANYLTATMDYEQYQVSYNANGYGTAPAAQIKEYNVDLKLRPFISPQTGIAGGTIQFNANGGSSTPSAINWTKTATQIKWTTQANGTGDQYNSEGTYSKNANAILYAKWSLSNNAITLPTAISRSPGSMFYTVTLNANGGSCSTPSLTSSVKINYSFGGWNKNSAGTGSNYNPSSSYTPDAENTTLFAKWNVVNMQATAITLPTATRPGYIFKGWGTNATSQSPVNNSYTPSKNITLYAIWEVWSYTISYNANGGSGTMDNSQHEYKDNSKLSANLFTNGSKSFIGWHINSEVDIPMYGDQSTAPYERITENGQTLTLYAIWSNDSPWKTFRPYIYHNGTWIKI